MRDIDKSSIQKASVSVAVQRQLNVMHAVILRDIRGRYMNHALGALIPPLMPIAHVLILLTIYNVVGRSAIFGEDRFLFYASGLVPALTFMYISRYMAASVLANKGMLAFPAVHLLDIILARCALEFAGIVLSIVVIFTILISIGTDPYPTAPDQALLALASVAMLALGVGVIVSVISAIYPFFATVFSLSMIFVYLSSDGPIYLHVFPETVLYAASFNPIFHAVEWMRSAYYVGYPTQWLDKQYLIMWGMISLPVGLLMERTLRRHVLAR